MLRAAATPAVARQLAASAVAVVLPSSGSSNATGQITHTTALPAQPVGTVGVYLPAGVVTAGSQGTGAGVYQAIYSSTTVCQLTGTGIVTANAAYTQVITEVVLATTTIPAGAMGLNGGLMICPSWTFSNSAVVKTPRVRLGGIGGTIYSGLALTTNATWADTRRIRNRNSAALQVGGAAAATASPVGSSSLALPTSSLDTTAAVDLVFTAQLAAATEYMILENRETWLLP